MTDPTPESELTARYKALDSLTRERNSRVQALRAEIDLVNRRYDREATSQRRKIAQLERTIQEAQKEKARQTAPAAKPPKDLTAEINAWNREHGLPEIH